MGELENCKYLYRTLLIIAGVNHVRQCTTNVYLTAGAPPVTLISVQNNDLSNWCPTLLNLSILNKIKTRKKMDGQVFSEKKIGPITS